MSRVPTRVVVDTNVAVVANRRHPNASPQCVAASAEALRGVMVKGHLFLDDGGQIVDEYRSNLSAKGEPGPGDVFLKWVLTNEWGRTRCTRVTITPKASDPQDFDEVPVSDDGTQFDPSDRKFLAVAAAHPKHPPILQSLDSKWWGWTRSLSTVGIRIHFLCPKEIAVKHAEKMGK